MFSTRNSRLLSLIRDISEGRYNYSTANVSTATFLIIMLIITDKKRIK